MIKIFFYIINIDAITFLQVNFANFAVVIITIKFNKIIIQLSNLPLTLLLMFPELEWVKMYLL